MRENILFSLFFGIIAYSITVLISLLLGHPLAKVLYNGLIALFIILLLTFAITIFLEKENFSNSKDDNEDEDNSIDADDKKLSENDDNKEENQDDEFSPMNPTVLEVEEEDN